MAVMLGEKIKELRNIRGVSAAQLAEQLGVSAAAVSKWENGVSNPRYKFIDDICRALHVPESLFNDWVPDSHFKNMSEIELDELCSQYIDSDNKRFRSIYDFLYKDNPKLGKIYMLLDCLNAKGKEEAVKRVEELTEIPRYKAKPDRE